MSWEFGQGGYQAQQSSGNVGGFEALPKGKYLACIEQSERKPTKAGDGAYMELKWTVLEPEQFKGKPLFSRLNLENKSSEAVNIARGELDAICTATGVMRPTGSHDLHDIPCILDVDVEPRKDMPGQHSNRIRGYYPRNSAQAQQAEPTTAGTAGTDRAPWKRGG